MMKTSEFAEMERLRAAVDRLTGEVKVLTGRNSYLERQLALEEGKNAGFRELLEIKFNVAMRKV